MLYITYIYTEYAMYLYKYISMHEYIYVFIYKINKMINYPMTLNFLSPGFHNFQKTSLD